MFLSAIRLRNKKVAGKRPGPASGPWALDSGGFSELTQHGRWTVSPEQYADETQGWARTIGRMEWAAVQDYMCEPHVLKITGLTVREHQARTIASTVRLRELAPGMRWAPVLQGFAWSEYVDHAIQYGEAGIDLRSEPVVGIGSVCRRQGTAEVSEAVAVIRELASAGIKLHGFGFKLTGLLECARATGPTLASADSLAWSKQASVRAPLPECAETHRSCANCRRYAHRWRDDMLARVAGEAP